MLNRLRLFELVGVDEGLPVLADDRDVRPENEPRPKGYLQVLAARRGGGYWSPSVMTAISVLVVEELRTVPEPKPV
jgi:hypothetical protein